MNKIDARFRLSKGDFTLDVDLQLPAQGISVLYGPSGSGKTTLLRLIAGLEKPQNGFLKVADTVWQQGNYFRPVHQRSIGYVFQEASLFSHLTVQQNIEYGLKRVPVNKQQVALEQAIELLDINRLLQRKPATLSGGERQRVAIARALAVSPRLLLMDEPLASLDAKHKQEILPYIVALQQALTIPVIYISHAYEELIKLADHLVLLQAGRVLASGHIVDTLTRLDLPLAHSYAAAAVIEATVVDYDPVYHLSCLEFAAGRLTIAGHPAKMNEQVRLQLAARDVSITLTPPVDTSILNVLPATINEISYDSPAHVTVRLLTADIPILSRITRKSADELQLQPGKPVYVQVKSMALIEHDY